MIKSAAFAAMLVFGLAMSVSASPLYDVWQDTDGDGAKDAFVGSVMAYTGLQNAYGNMYYYSASVHPINGPTPEARRSKMFLYDGSDGLSFGFFHNIDAGGNPYWNRVDWDIKLTNMTSAFGLGDDGDMAQSEFKQIDAFNYTGRWNYILNTDGGMIKNMMATESYWEIAIDPLAFGDVRDWGMYSGNGTSLNLWNNPMLMPAGLGSNDVFSQDTDAYTTYITPHIVPEPMTLLLIGAGLLGTGLVTRKRK